jgi:endonuclease G
MSLPSQPLPTWAVVLILVVIGVAIWVAHLRAQREAPNPPVVVEPKDKPPETSPTPTSTGPATASADNVALGAPSNASTGTPDDYLISRTAYALSFNRSRGIPNWVAWHLSAADLGPIERGQFAPDPMVPKDWGRITPNDYRNIGYDRGHMCPSGDRTVDKKLNAETFLMTNIVPQAADNNQGPWADLEDYCRSLAKSGNELYIVAGVGGPFSTTNNGKLAVPASTWKVVVVLPEGADDASRVNAKTRVIAVVMPNASGIRDRDWKTFRTTAQTIEAATGLHFFSKVAAQARSALESRVDAQ